MARLCGNILGLEVRASGLDAEYGAMAAVQVQTRPVSPVIAGADIPPPRATRNHDLLRQARDPGRDVSDELFHAFGQHNPCAVALRRRVFEAVREFVSGITIPEIRSRR